MILVRKIRGSLHRKLPPVSIFLDDVENLVDIVGRATSDPVVTLGVDEYSLDSVKELESLGGRKVKELRVGLKAEFNKPYVDVEVGDSVRIYANMDTPASRGIVDEVEELLRPKRRILSFEEARYVWAIWATMFAVGLGITLLPRTVWWSDLGFVFQAIGLVVLFRSMFVKSKIILRRRAQMQSFWQRNRDPIIVAAIASLLTAIATFLVTWISGCRIGP